jgi:hypothetical protein
MPRDGPEPRIQALPEVQNREATSINASWIIAAVLLLALLLIGFAIFRAASPTTGARTATPVAGQPTAAATRAAAEGALPDFRGETVDAATARLREIGVPYVVIQLPQANTPAGQVYDQSPRPGARLSQGMAVTLWVARAQ